MAEPVVKRRETEEVKTLIQSANSDQWAKMAEAVTKERETELIKPVSNTVKPNMMVAAVAKDRESDEIKTPHGTLKPAQMAEALASKKFQPVDPRHVTIHVKSQDGKNKFFRIKRDAPLKKLLIAYCKKCSVDYPSAKFLIDGDRFNHNKTSEDMELEDEAEIEVMVENLGGGETCFA